MAIAQDLGVKTPKYLISFKRWIQNNPTYFTDTVKFELPNGGKVISVFNPEKSDREEVIKAFETGLKNATKFPEGETLYYHLNPNWVIPGDARYFNKKYTSRKGAITLGFPLGLDYLGGEFAPEIGFRATYDMTYTTYGLSLTNTFLFTPKTGETGINVHTNPFVNFEFGFLPPARRNTISVGYLLKEEGPIFIGDTFRAAYAFTFYGNMQIKTSMIFTDGFDTIIPTIGIRFF